MYHFDKVIIHLTCFYAKICYNHVSEAAPCCCQNSFSVIPGDKYISATLKPIPVLVLPAGKSLVHVTGHVRGCFPESSNQRNGSTDFTTFALTK